MTSAAGRRAMRTGTSRYSENREVGDRPQPSRNPGLGSRDGQLRTGYPVTSPIKSLDMHPNGRWIVSIHNDNMIRIWDAFTGDPVGEFADGTKKITVCRFSPSGHRLLCRGRGLPDFSVVNPENGEVSFSFAFVALPSPRISCIAT